MGSTGEPDRKRRHFSTISPTAANAKKQPFSPISEDKKLDAAVLQFQNQKLVQKLEAQKIECIALESKFNQLRKKQQLYDSTLDVVNKSWEEVLDDLESSSTQTKDALSCAHDAKPKPVRGDGASSPLEDAFLSRLIETGATESSISNNSTSQMEEDRQMSSEKSKTILRNIVGAIDDLWYLKDGLYAAVLKSLPENGSCRQKMSSDIDIEVKNLRAALSDLHIKHKSLARERQNHRDAEAKNKSELKRLKGELESTVTELEDSNCKLATLKAERDAAAKGAAFPVLHLGSKHVAGDRARARDKQKDLQDMKSALKELLDQASCRLLELKRLHEERIGILNQLSKLQNALKSAKCIFSSQAYILVRDQLAKSKAEVVQYQTLFEKLQVEKDNLLWREKEMIIKGDLVDVFHRTAAVADSRITELEVEMERQINQRNLIETKLGETSKEPGRKEIIAEFKALVSSFPENMGSMQNQLSKYKEAASDVHSLRADVKSLSHVLERKAKELESLSARSSDQVAEMKKLKAVVHDLKESDMELNLILEMYQRESTDSRDVLEARDSEYKAWAHVQSLKSSLDEHNLELRVKTAIEAEAMSQQRLAAAEAEIADLRQKLESSKREKLRLSDSLKSKHEENEAYLSEIETIGQAYDDMQTQNQHLLQQVTERDDYNIKLVLEGVQARQLRDALLMEKQTMEKAIQLASNSVVFGDMKAARIEEQLKMCLDHVQKNAEDRLQNSATLEAVQKKILDVGKSSQQLKVSLEASQSELDRSRVDIAGMQIELEKERFEKKRLEEDLEAVQRKISCLKSHSEGSSIVEKLHQELREYKEILKCSICINRGKEVVITKCFHLFCNPCVQRIIETRHRKCPVCAASFGANDVKPVYI